VTYEKLRPELMCPCLKPHTRKCHELHCLDLRFASTRAKLNTGGKALSVFVRLLEKNFSCEKEQFHFPAKLFSSSKRQDNLSQELCAGVTRLLVAEELVYS